ncbi:MULTISPECIES: thiazole synthase [unclassified Microcoleus]|uniref:thiazole synthase n=1 Tax=unclassified Microcoleus TaxID=2642155 RepID=UPI002FD1C6E5
MEDHFSEFKEIVTRGLQNNMPRDAKLITLGQILSAVTHDDLTIEEAWQLEAMLGGRKQWEEAVEYSIFGYPVDTATPSLDKPLVIAGKTFHSRLMTGTGKYRSIAEMQQSVNASRCEIVTVAVRRVQTNAPGHEGLAEALDWTKIWMLPNTAGCQTADEAIRVARLGREMAKLLGQEDNNFVKLEVIPDAKYLLPDPIGTLEAAEQLVKEGFAVLPYINADPLLAKRLEEVGCATVMPLGSPIGSGQGINNAANIQIIIDTVKIPVVVDAGIGTPSEAAQAMEMGADALLINSAIANAQNSPAMAKAMGMAAEAGRLAYLAGRMPVKDYAIASSPETGTVNSK